MNVNNESEVRYVIAVPPNGILKLRKGSFKNPVGKVIHCQELTSLQNMNEETEIPPVGDSDSEVELTVVSSSDSTLVVHHPSDNEARTSVSEPSVKRSKTDDTVERNSSNSNFSDKRVFIHSSSIAKHTIMASAEKEDLDYIPLGGYHAKPSAQDSDRRQSKYKVFRDEWLDIDIFRDWLDRDPENPRKARCVACNTTMNAGKSELEKHAAGARHERALEAMHQTIMLQQLAVTETEVEEIVEDTDCAEDDDSFSGSSKPGDPGSHSTAEQPLSIEQSMHPEGTTAWQEQQVEAINRMAIAIESLSSNITLLLERLSAQQEELIHELRELHKK